MSQCHSVGDNLLADRLALVGDGIQYVQLPVVWCSNPRHRGLRCATCRCPDTSAIVPSLNAAQLSLSSFIYKNYVCIPQTTHGKDTVPEHSGLDSGL
jgi:hypothetical protein